MAPIYDRKSYEERRDAILWWGDKLSTFWKWLTSPFRKKP